MHRAGIALSALCLAHCLLVPLALAAVPLSLFAWLPADWIGSEWFHAALLVPVVMVSGPALFRGGQIAALVGGLAALTGALFIGDERAEIALTVAGALTLLGAHWLTLRQARSSGQ